jgi:hypothetical protein
MMGPELIRDADGCGHGKRGGAQQIGIAILLVRKGPVHAMRRLLRQHSCLVRHVRDGLARSTAGYPQVLRRLSCC